MWNDGSWTGLKGSRLVLGLWFSCSGTLGKAGCTAWPGWTSSWKQAWCEHMQISATLGVRLSWKMALASDGRPQKRRQPQRGRVWSV